MKKFLHLVNNYSPSIFQGGVGKERIFLILITFFLVAIWFRRGLILGAGESGLPFYNSAKLWELTSHSWTDVPIGTSGTIGSASYPFYAILTFLADLGVPAFIVQAFLYWALLVIGMLSIHKIAALITGHTSVSRLSSALFYLFNPIAHVSVLHRLQYPLMFFYSFLPLAFLVYTQGLQEKKIDRIVYLCLISVFFSFAFIGLSNVIIIFSILGLYSLWIALRRIRNRKINWYPVYYFVVFASLFILVHMWWLVPLVSSVTVDLGSNASVKYFNSSDNITTFKAISASLGSVLSIFKLVSVQFYSRDAAPAWGWIYSTIPFIILSFIPILTFIIGLFKREIDNLFKFLAFVALITFFFSKGSLPPLGSLTSFLFERFTVLQVFRNPFEKLGLIIPFTMAIPLGFGVAFLVNRLSVRFKIPKKLVVSLMLLLMFPVYMFPIVNGYVFTGSYVPANNLNVGQFVSVPDYYQEAAAWLDQQDDLFRVLVLPMNGEGMTYRWDYGFSGVELSNNIFNQSMISFNASQAYLPEMISLINDTLVRFPGKFWVLSQAMNIKYIMVRDDIDYIAREVESPAKVAAAIQEKLGEDFSFVAGFGKLKLFEIDSNLFRPRIYASTTPAYLIDPVDRGMKMLPFTTSGSTNLFINTADLPNDSYLEASREILLSGVRVENIDTDTNKAVEQLPFVTVHRGTPFYGLVRLKEELEIRFQSPDNQLDFRVNLLGKRVAELTQSPADLALINEYKSLLISVSSEIKTSKDMDLAYRLVLQKEALKQLPKQDNSKQIIEELVYIIDDILVSMKAKSVFETKSDLIYRFQVPKDSSYEILVSKEQWERYIKDIGINKINLDGRVLELDVTSQLRGLGNSLSLGNYVLNKGVHEVSFLTPEMINLIPEDMTGELLLSSEERNPLVKSIPISPLDVNNAYQISFEYLEEKGNVPVVSIVSDTDPLDIKGERIPRFGVGLSRSDYDFSWKRYSGYFYPNPAANKHEILIKILPYGDCKAVVQKPYRRYCEDNEFNKKFLRDSSTRIRNLQVSRIFSNLVMLKGDGSSVALDSPPQVEFQPISSARYKVKIESAKAPYYLVLSTAYDPRWGAYFLDSDASFLERLGGSLGGTAISPEKHVLVNGYSNAWYIDKQGDYEMFLEYKPERIFVLGRKLSLAVISLILVFLFVRRVNVWYHNR